MLSLTLVALAVCNSADAAGAPVACGKTKGLLCSQVDVPLDRMGQTPGSISLHVELLPASGTPRGAMFLIAGGPGQPSAGVFSLGTADAAASYRALFPGYALIAYDGRGTGRSAALKCPFGSSGEASLSGASCSSALGPQRDFYGTGDQAEDLDLVRQALGFDRVALWGTSYGTKLALAYALAHPSHVERLLLDSVVPTEFPDPFGANMLRMIPTALSNFCASTACRAVEPDYAADIVAVANSLAATPLSGKVLLPDGSKTTATLDGLEFLSLVVAADLNPGLAAELPAAVRAARQGNAQPLLHTLLLYVTRASGQQASDLNSAVYAATVCHDGPFPWLSTSPVADRVGLLQSTIDALPSDSLGPFGHWAADLGTARLCLGWPSAVGGAPVGSGPLPDVPVLALSGGFDMRTPTVDAMSVVARFPRGQLLVVPGVGHGVLESGATCPEQAVRSWLAGRSVPKLCPRPKPLVALVDPYSTSSTQARVGPERTLGIAASTAREAEAAWVLLVESGRSNATVPGIYGGTLHTSGRTFTLAHYSVTPGVTLSGKLFASTLSYPLIFFGTLHVAGPAASAGTLTAFGSRLVGTLGGRRVRG